MTGFAAHARILSEYLTLEDVNNLEELLMQYIVNEADLREQEKLSRKRLDLRALSDVRFDAALAQRLCP